MKYIQLIIIYLFIFIKYTKSSNIENENTKISNNLLNIINNNNHNNNNNNNNNNILKLWISFNSKDIINDFNTNNDNNNNFIDTSSGERLSTSNIIDLSGIHDDSLKRRLKRSTSTSIIDNYDFPVSNYFINEIIDCNKNHIKLNYKSNWLNSISISINNTNNYNNNSNNNLNEILECIKSKSFVNNIDMVSKYNRENNNIDNNKLKNSNNKIKNSSNNKFKYINNKFHQKILELNINNNNDNSNNNNNNIYYNKTINELFNNNSSGIKFNEKFYGQSYRGLKLAGIDKLHQKGYFGTGVKILIIDSGFLKDHETFKHLNLIGEYNFVDKNNNTQDTFDPKLKDPTMSQNAHGTGTLSVIAGFSPGKLIGPAFNASYFLAKTEIVLEENLIEEDYWIAALEMGERMGIELVTTSLGYKEFFRFSDLNGKTTRISKAANLAIKKGLVIVISGGNDSYKGIDSPTDCEYVIAVGGLSGNTMNTRSEISSTGPTSDGRIKPDVMALGEQVQIAYFTGMDHYKLERGTSFSSQIVAGGIALLMEQHKNWTVYQIYEAITKTSSKANTPDVELGYGIFNAFEASQYTPSSHSCIDLGCYNNGICKLNDHQNFSSQYFKELSIGECYCPPAYYGLLCQYKRIECNSKLCEYRYGVCQINQHLDSNGKNSSSFNCVNPNKIKKLIANYDPYNLILNNPSVNNNSIINNNTDNSNSFVDNNSTNNDNKNDTNNNKNNDKNNSANNSLDLIIENNTLISNEKFILIVCLIVGVSVLIITILVIITIKLFLNAKYNLNNKSII